MRNVQGLVDMIGPGLPEVGILEVLMEKTEVEFRLLLEMLPVGETQVIPPFFR